MLGVERGWRKGEEGATHRAANAAHTQVCLKRLRGHWSCSHGHGQPKDAYARKKSPPTSAPNLRKPESYSWSEHRFSSQHPRGGSKPFTTPVPGGLTPFSGLQALHAYGTQVQMPGNARKNKPYLKWQDIKKSRSGVSSAPLCSEQSRNCLLCHMPGVLACHVNGDDLLCVLTLPQPYTTCSRPGYRSCR